VEKNSCLVVDGMYVVGFSGDQMVYAAMIPLSSALRDEASKGRTEMCP
jgi:hypothetical protein